MDFDCRNNINQKYLKATKIFLEFTTIKNLLFSSDSNFLWFTLFKSKFFILSLKKLDMGPCVLVVEAID